MKTFFLFITVLIFTYSEVQSQSEIDSLRKIDKKTNIHKIDSIKKVIESNLNNYQKIILLNDSINSKYKFFNNKELKLITVYVKDVKIEKYVSWYFNSNEMVFCEQFWIDKNNNLIFNTNRAYLINETLFLYYDSENNNIDMNSQEFKDLSVELKNLSKVFKEESISNNN